jgi:hypothetical protein
MCLNLGRSIPVFALTLCVTTVFLGHAQQSAGLSVGPLSGEPRFFAPFAADAITNIVQRRRDGGRAARRVVMKYYRDSFGRVRVEYTPTSTDDSARTVALVVPNPYAQRDRVFLVDDDAKLVEWRPDFMNLAGLFDAARAIAIPTGVRRFTVFPGAEGRYSGNGLVEDLGSRMIDGVRADGTRFTTTLSKAMDERWESPDLGLVVRARYVDSERGWEVDYTLTDIRQTEPKQELFVMPAGYHYSPGADLRLESPEGELLRLAGDRRP